MTESEVKEFIERCYSTGKKVYGSENVTQMKYEYTRIAVAPFFTESTIFLPVSFAIMRLGNREKRLLSHETSHLIASTNKTDSRNDFDKYEKVIIFSNRNWSNYLITAGMEEGREESGSDRILSFLNEREAIEEHRKSDRTMFDYWALACESLLRDLKKFSNGVYRTSDVFSLLKGAFDSERRKEAIELKMGIESFFVAPHYRTSYPLISKLNDSEFQKFVKRWKPRDIDEEITGIDPIPYFLVSHNFDVPKDHQRAIEDEIAFALSVEI